MEQLGRKDDKGKPRWYLIPWTCMKEVAEVLTSGADRYGDHNWTQVENPGDRYFSACMRHLTAWVHGEKKDLDSGRHHLAHAICCLLFLMWFDRRNSESKT